jgi:hypothetical protein
VVQGVLSWQNIGQFVYNQVVIRRNGQPVLTAQVPGSFTRLTGLLQDTYTPTSPPLIRWGQLHLRLILNSALRHRLRRQVLRLSRHFLP